YELHCTIQNTKISRKHTILELIISVCIMLIAAKYAWYILVIQFVLLMFYSIKRWKIWVLCILLPTILIHGAIIIAISSGAIINGDPIESRGVQLQQIARIAKLDPKSIPHKAAREIAPIFNLNQTAEAYTPQDADPVKSSGLQSKKVSYRWRYITKDDMKKFNHAWWLMVKHSPIVATDAFLAKSYGYFDILDIPYVGPEYYINTDNIKNSEWIRYWLPEWRAGVSNTVESWSNTPILGWLIHGNLYVVGTLLIGVAEIVLKRWKTLVLHIPLALLMGVMVLAPANNFERHMLPITFVFFFTALTFLRESKLLGRDNIIDITSNTKIENTSQLPKLPKLNIETIGGDK
ncbi:beta-carotene 15,15'-monooxygenase, partial [Gardnerella vaginalis]